MTQWFGTSWGAPVCDPADHVPTPVGQDCLMGCGRVIAADDQGLVLPHSYLDDEGEVRGELRGQHLDCFLKAVGLPHRAQ